MRYELADWEWDAIKPMLCECAQNFDPTREAAQRFDLVRKI
jgi:hypothetical protein